MAPGQKLPAWYYRLVALTIKKDREVLPEDFDEDLSDLDSTSNDSGEGKNPSDPDCDCDDEDCECDDQSSQSSERSYNGSDADYYYELKDEREERKEELWDIKVEERKEKERWRKFESAQVEEVQAAHKSLQQAEIKGHLPSPSPLHSIAGKYFRLYSLDHFEYRYDPVIYPSKYVEFYYIEKGDNTRANKQPPTKETKIQGHLYLNVDCGCDFASFSPPTQAGLEKYSLKDFEGKFAPIFQFISNDHLIVTVPRDLVFMDVPGDPLAPDMFTFYGVRYDHKEKKRRRDEERQSQRSPSSRETWFERSHPMGAWNMGGW
ncbi:hypothetical protein GGI42DRAFT_165734 [Trichoderma sp. SZMC 28013]